MRVAVIVAVLCAALSPAAAENKLTGLGIGAELGHPSALTLKSFVGDKLALQGGIGTGVFRGTGLYVYGDFLFTVAALSPGTSLYVGPGLRVWDHHYSAVSRYDRGRDTHFGLRVPFGVSIHVTGHPLEIFVEAGIVVDVASGKGCNRLAPNSTYCRSDGPVDLLASFGIRYYLGGKR
jgi:hypothetical protein